MGHEGSERKLASHCGTLFKGLQGWKMSGLGYEDIKKADNMLPCLGKCERIELLHIERCQNNTFFLAYVGKYKSHFR
jgi:hypothetical protein